VLALLFDLAVFESKEYSGAMCLPTATFFTTVQKVADQILVQRVPSAEFRNAYSSTIKRLAGLLGRNCGGHSVRSCCFVFMSNDYDRLFGRVKGLMIENVFFW
jgi:hypothetical protein